MSLFHRLKTMLTGHRVNVSTRFALLREAISGTMSKFYMARDLQSGKIVGLKILDIEKTAAFEARFRGLDKPSEGEIAMKLKHPRIVETYEYGTTTDGAQYLIMEFLEGPGVNSLLVDRNPCLEQNLLRLLRQAAEAVGAVHAAGFIHRDICPRNFLVTKDGKDLKLIDFGVTVPASPQFLQPGVRVGNPNYMAPEVVRRKPIDQRLDVFAFGVTAYENVHLPTPLAPRQQRPGGHEPRQAADRYPSAPAKPGSRPGQGHPLVPGSGAQPPLPLDGEVSPGHQGSQTGGGCRRGIGP